MTGKIFWNFSTSDHQVTGTILGMFNPKSQIPEVYENVSHNVMLINKDSKFTA